MREISEMWRRASMLSPLFSSSKHSLLNQMQAAYGLGIRQMFCTEIQKAEEGGTSPRGTTPFITFVLGGPGSGKGTQCARIVENFGFTHLSAGDLLRSEISSNSENGDMILKTIKDGKIVPSEVTVKLIQKAIQSSENDKFLIDGFPRSEENRLTYEKIVGLLGAICESSNRPFHANGYDYLNLLSVYLDIYSLIGAEPNIVLFFDCPEEEMIKRVLNRRQGRVDDNEYTVKERLKVFSALSLPVVNYYSKKGKLCKIDATGTKDEIFEQVRSVFAA